jgi:2-keto-3-deoxy-L-fuconate dehydrogenase
VVATDLVDGPWREDRGVVGAIGSPEWSADVEAALEGRCDAVVAAHGIEGTGPLDELSAERVAQVMSVNLVSVLTLFDVVAAPLRAGDGAFVAISSQAGLQGEPSSTAYCASKFSLLAWCRAMAVREPGIRFRTLCPGATETPLLRKAFEGWAAAEGVGYEDILNRRSGAVPVGRLGRPSDIGAGAAWLAQLDTRSHVTGLVSGGEVRL